MTHGKEVLEGLREHTIALRKLIPDVYREFGNLGKAAMAPGALDVKTKELIALAVGVAEHCDGCIATHARAAARAGATHQEVAEMLGVVILMVGGPGSVYGPRALAAFSEYAEHFAKPGGVGPAPAEAAPQPSSQPG